MLILSKIYAVKTRHPRINEPANLINFFEELRFSGKEYIARLRKKSPVKIL
jgi:hypothetical protein